MNSPETNHTIAVAAVGTKGQIVIPQEIREKLAITPGDKVVLMMRGDHAAVILPMSGMREWLDHLAARIDSLEESKTTVRKSQED